LPSAADVAKDGVSLGEMNKLLTKKVEELTLYLIKMDIQDQKRDALLKSLQRQIKSVKAKNKL
jgi:hypothetical protein